MGGQPLARLVGPDRAGRRDRDGPGLADPDQGVGAVVLEHLQPDPRGVRPEIRLPLGPDPKVVAVEELRGGPGVGRGLGVRDELLVGLLVLGGERLPAGQRQGEPGRQGGQPRRDPFPHGNLVVSVPASRPDR